MLYIFLKNILESVISNYKCPECGSQTNAEQLNILGISSRWIDLHLVCSVCGIHSQLSAEVNTMASELLSTEDGKKFFDEFIKNGGTISPKMINKKNLNAKWINEADIAKIDNDIKNAKTIEDLMK